MEVWKHYCQRFMESQQEEILLLCDGHKSHVLDPVIHHRIRMEKLYPGSTSMTQVFFICFYFVQFFNSPLTIKSISG
jgi:hypothetical protein